MAKNTKPRISYKTLYQSSQTKLHDTETSNSNLRDRLEEINSALIPEGRKFLEGSKWSKPGPIYVSPFEFVITRAFLEAGFIIDEGPGPLGYTSYAWRGRAIVRRA